MADFDIGSMLFRDILGMNYPGSPFTGSPINDLVMFFFIPTVFLIVFVWVITSRLPIIGGSGKIKLLFALAIYLYVIFGGYFSFFALLAGPYFIILIFLIGILWFIGGHFGGGGHGSSDPSKPTGAAMSVETSPYAQYENMSWTQLQVSKDRIKKEIESIDKEIKESHRLGEAGRLEELRKRRWQLEAEMYEVHTQLDIVKKRTRKFGLG